MMMAKKESKKTQKCTFYVVTWQFYPGNIKLRILFRIFIFFRCNQLLVGSAQYPNKRTAILQQNEKAKDFKDQKLWAKIVLVSIANRLIHSYGKDDISIFPFVISFFFMVFALVSTLALYKCYFIASPSPIFLLFFSPFPRWFGWLYIHWHIQCTLFYISVTLRHRHLPSIFFSLKGVELSVSTFYYCRKLFCCSELVSHLNKSRSFTSYLLQIVKYFNKYFNQIHASHSMSALCYTISNWRWNSVIPKVHNK